MKSFKHVPALFFILFFFNSNLFAGIDEFVVKKTDGTKSGETKADKIDYTKPVWGLQINFASISYQAQDNNPDNDLKVNTQIISAGIQPAFTYYPGNDGYFGLGSFLFMGGNLNDKTNFRINWGCHISLMQDWLVLGAGIDFINVAGDRTTGLFGRIAGDNDFKKTSDGRTDWRENIMIFIGSRYNIGNF